MSRRDHQFKTIAAVATPAGFGGIGVIRLSGSESIPLVRRLFVHGDESSLTPNHASLHQIVNPETGQLVDEAIVTFFQAPHSFTGEDVVEISGHGSPVLLAEVLRLLISLGASPAEPGEFSLRAFFNGRMDLAQAEAIKDLIHAQTTYQAQLAARQLRGELSRQLKPIKEGLVNLIVHFESAVEFVEDDLDPLDAARFSGELDSMIERISRLAGSYRIGRVIRSGFKLALIGRPNVGKSSVFNSLLGRDRAIVTSIPGTTRDAVTEALAIRGIPVELVDTAGIRETVDLVEQLGVERTRSAVSEADLVVAVLDASVDSIEEDLLLIDQLPVHLYVLNKCDLEIMVPEAGLSALAEKAPVLKVSALTGDGIEELKNCIYQQITAGTSSIVESAIITSERHFAALEQTRESLRRAQEDLHVGLTEEVVLANLHEALRSLGVITGETLIADLINQIFATFCIGK
jgi:tRNA modification GTPase